MRYLMAGLIFVFMSGCASHDDKRYYEAGVSDILARYRKEHVSDVRYRLGFAIPVDSREEIPGSAEIEFNLSGRLRRPLLVDFNVPAEYLRQLTVNGITVPAVIEGGHIAIEQSLLKRGVNLLNLAFRTGELSLNRNDDYLYTLLVPDRASTAFPCFDQPDIKARFSLTLEIPGDYEAMSNSAVSNDTRENGRRRIEFEEGKPISTYLFAFAAGRFGRVTSEADGMVMEMLHRETDTAKVRRNLEQIFGLHAAAIRWMEDYTGIEYPFGKFGFVLIPSFQYGGMEHPGAIFYRSSTLMTDESPTINELLSRASLIAHETSHIWFGDLVTMKWFDDVWLKEVFAGYMADKIVHPSFPEVNHELSFLLSRYPAAYAVDRTRGSNPVIQELDNLRNAGSLYGGIIYNKAPVVMKHLEQMTGDSILRRSLQIYLERFSFANAEWDDLIGIIEEVSGLSLRDWSQVWVREPGMPVINAIVEPGPEGYRTWFSATDPVGEGRTWQQNLNALVYTDEGTFSGICIPGEKATGVLSKAEPRFVIHDGTGLAYGYFAFDSVTAAGFTDFVMKIDDEVARGVVWLNSYENMLNGVIAPSMFFESALQNALKEENEILRNYITGRASSVFWNNLTPVNRAVLGPAAERMVWERICSEDITTSERRSWLSLYRSLALTPEALDKLYSVWKSAELPGGQQAGEEDLCSIALTLALKGHSMSEVILADQADRIRSNERRQRFEFVMEAVSYNQEARDRFFESLKDPSGREKEPWVLEALGYLHHPLREGSSERYILPSLEMLEEIKFTGDIFFPAGWAGAILGSYQSATAWESVTGFLERNPDYPADLKLKILQAADNIYRHNEGPIK